MLEYLSWRVRQLAPGEGRLIVILAFVGAIATYAGAYYGELDQVLIGLGILGASLSLICLPAFTFYLRTRVGPLPEGRDLRSGPAVALRLIRLRSSEKTPTRSDRFAAEQCI